jgi:hypothetical protein
LTFVPFALVFGAVSERAGVDRAGWLLVAIAAVAAVLVIVVLPQAPAPVGEAAPVLPAPAAEGKGASVFPVDRFVPPDDPEWPGHWANPPAAWDALGVAVDGAGALEQARQAIAELPPALRAVIVLRDVEGATPDEAQRALELRPEDEQALLHQARGLVRARLERYLEGRGSNHERSRLRDG